MAKATTTEPNNNSPGEGAFRVRIKTVSAFKWDGRTRDAHNVPTWVVAISRGATLNEGTDPPGLIVETLHSGGVNVPHDCWFVYHVEAGIAMARTDLAFQSHYEENT